MNESTGVASTLSIYIRENNTIRPRSQLMRQAQLYLYVPVTRLSLLDVGYLPHSGTSAPLQTLLES